MKKIIVNVVVFLAASAIASGLVNVFVSVQEEDKSFKCTGAMQPPDLNVAVSGKAGAATLPASAEAIPEFTDLPGYDERNEDVPVRSNKLIDVFETGGLYRESEVVAKSGETWLALYDRGGKSSLVISKAKLSTISYPGDESDVRLKFDHPGMPIFALRNLRSIKAGPVTTLYHHPSNNEIERRNLPIDPMTPGFKREFSLEESQYTLRVVKGLTKSKTDIAVLVLENGSTSQIIALNEEMIIGDLLWVGDLDNDGKLDLYFDEFNEKGYFSPGLYLSSAAEQGKLVKLVANFSQAGC